MGNDSVLDGIVQGLMNVFLGFQLMGPAGRDCRTPQIQQIRRVWDRTVAMSRIDLQQYF